MNIRENRIKTLNHILQHGEHHFSMLHWFQIDGFGNSIDYVADAPDMYEKLLNECGTTACLAGHAALALDVSNTRDALSTIVEMLEIPEEVFFDGNWKSISMPGGTMEDYRAKVNGSEYLTIIAYLSYLIGMESE